MMQTYHRYFVQAILLFAWTAWLLPQPGSAANVIYRQEKGQGLIEVQATVSGAWHAAARTASNQLIWIIDLELSGSSHSVGLESSYRTATLGDHTLTVSAGVTQSGVLLHGLLPAHDPDDGWATQLEARIGQSVELEGRMKIDIGARVGFDSVFRTGDILPEGALSAMILDDVRAQFRYSEFMSDPGIGSQYGEFRFRTASVSVVRTDTARVGWAVEASWIRGLAVRNDRVQAAAGLVGNSGYTVRSRIECAIVPGLSIAFGANVRSGFALRMAEASADRATFFSANAAVRLNLNSLLQGLRIEAIGQNLGARPIPDFGGGPGHGRSGTIRILYAV